MKIQEELTSIENGNHMGLVKMYQIKVLQYI